MRSTPRALTRAVVGAAAATLLTGLLATVPAEAAPVGAAPVGSYLVTLSDAASPRSLSASTAASLTDRHGGEVRVAWQHALNGFAARLTPAQARAMAADPAVSSVEADGPVHALYTQLNPPSWGLDRIDQRNLPLDNRYNYDTFASNVNAYIIDTGVRLTHTEFGGRATFGVNTTGDGDDTDCNGHGTHVAGTVGGVVSGVAKGVRLIAVKVLNCAGSGTISGVISGIDWITAHHQAGQPAVANMSLGGGANATMDAAVRTSIADGVTYAVPSGGSNADACNFSPARVTEALTVNASDRNDNRASFTNYGPCTDLFAPGVGITSTWHTNDTATNTISGTSMSAPHVAGAAALWLATHPTATSAQVHAAIIANATPNKIVNPGANTPNRLLYTAPAQSSVVVANPGNQVGVAGMSSSLQLTATGGTTPYTWSATGLPPGLALNASTGLISGTHSTWGAYTVTATARDAGGRTGSTTFGWNVVTPPVPCGGSNGTDVPIPDLSTVESPITVTGCSTTGLPSSRVEVHIKHTYIGDLVVSLISPDGTAFVLHNRAGGGTDNLDASYTVNLSGEWVPGTWKLRVQDAASADVGYIDSWSISL